MTYKHTMSHTLKHKQTFNKTQKKSLDLLGMSQMSLLSYIKRHIESNPFLDYRDSSHASYDDTIGDISRPSLKETIYEQLSEINVENHAVFDFIIESLDDHGFFVESIDVCAETMNVSRNEVVDALRILYTFSPAGVFSRNSIHALINQAIQNNDFEVVMFLTLYKENLEKGDLRAISRKSNLTMDDVHAIFERMRTYNPFPCSDYDVDTKEYLVEDFIVEIDNESIKINTVSQIDLEIKDSYFEVIKENPELKSLFNDSVVFLENINRRNATLMVVAHEIINIQANHFMFQDEKVSLTQKNIAETLRINQSTVSRTIANKYYRFEGDIYPLSSLLVSSTRNGISSDSIKKAILEVIKDEDKTHPLSDEKIKKHLTNFDLDVSRRTIAKYRGLLRIPNASLRKKVGS